MAVEIIIQTVSAALIATKRVLLQIIISSLDPIYYKQITKSGKIARKKL